MKVVGESSELTPMELVGESSAVDREGNEDLPSPHWKLFVNGSMTRHKSEAGIILETPDGFKHVYALEFQFKTSNNVVEYESLIGGL